MTLASRLHILLAFAAASIMSAQTLSFSTKTIGAGRTPTTIVTGDFNGDGHLDAAIANVSSHNVTILLGSSSGVFTAAAGGPIAVGTRPGHMSLAVGDFDRDGMLDLAVVNMADNTVTILRGSGDGAFTPFAGGPLAVEPNVLSLVAGDFNGDDRLDLATASFLSGNVTVMLGNGSGGFSAAAGGPLPAGPGLQALATADLNRDGKLDLVCLGDDSVGIFLGDGSGAFTTPHGPIAAGKGSRPVSAVISDLDGDGKLDLAVLNSGTNNVIVLLGDDTGNFTPSNGGPLPVGIGPLAIAAGDFNGDGNPDLAATNSLDNTLTLLLGDGAGGFIPAAGSPFAMGGFPSALALGDFNRDGKLDFISTNGDDSVTVALSRADLRVDAAVSANNRTPSPRALSGSPSAGGAPTVASISPASGYTAGGTPVTITGAGFTGATAVAIGGAAATSVVVVSDTSITCRTPVGTAGLASVTVTTPGGSTPANTLYTYSAAPFLIPPQTFAYIPNEGAGKVSVIDTANNALTATISVGTVPFGVAFNPAGTVAYVVNLNSNNVSVINTATRSVTATVPVGTNPTGIAVNPAGTFAYVTNQTSHNVSIINTATNAVTSLTVGGRPWGVAFSPDGAKAYVDTGALAVIDTATNTVIATVGVGNNSRCVVVHPVASFAYVTNQDSNTVSVINTATNTVSATIPVASAPYGLAIHPAGTFVYVTHFLGTTVSVINTATNTVTATITVGSKPAAIAVDPAGAFLYVMNTGNNTVSRIDTATNAVTATFAVTSGANEFSPFIGATVPVTPASGAASGGTLVTISGSGFTGATGVTIGGVAASNVTVVSDTSITATTPAGSVGVASVLVTTAAGTNAANTAYTYLAAPTVTSISPSTGSTGGGTAVNITGTDFTGATGVTIGGAAASFTVVSSTSITATTPAGTGTAAIVVTTPGASSAANPLYTYVASPTVTSVSPSNGSTAGGTAVTITGTNFTGATGVTVQGSAATNVVVVSATSITCTTPAGTAGTASVVVTTPGGSNAANTRFTYIVSVPTVTSITPASGPAAGGTAVTIAGTGFTGATSVTIGGTAATNVVVVSGTSITATTPAHSAGTASVIVTTPGGSNAANALFTYLAAPTVSSISPNIGPSAGGTAVTITGAGFTGATNVTIGGTALVGVTVVSATSITGITPIGTAGTASVVVTTPGGSNSANTLYTYSSSQTITVTTSTPASTPYNGTFNVAATATSELAVSITATGACSVNSGGSGSAGILMTSGSGTCTVLFNQAGNANFNAAPQVSQSTTAQLAVPAVTFTGAPASLVYQGTFAVASTTNASTAPVYTASGSCSNTDSAYTMSSGTGSCTSTVTWAADNNYSGATRNQTTTATPLAASATPTASAKTYGAADPALTGTVSGFLPADGVTATFTRSTGEAVGGYPISATLSPAGALANYSITYNTAAFTINKAAASVTPNVNSKVYGAADPALTGTLSGFLAADGVTAVYARTAGETVGSGTISATLSPAGALANYEITYNTAAFTITAAPLTITASSQTKLYGAAVPAVTASYSGFVNGDTAASMTTPPACFSTATENSPVGSYPTSCGGAGMSNYSATYIGGSLEVTPLSVMAGVTASNKVYDGTTAASIAGCTVNVVLPVDAGSVACSAASASFASASTGTGIAVTATGIALSGARAANYALPSATASTAANITAAQTATVVTSLSNPALLGQSVTFTATVTSAAPSPSGTVTFRDGSATLLTEAVNGSGQASFSIASLGAGAHAISAVFNGSGNFLGSTGTTLIETVVPVSNFVISDAAAGSSGTITFWDSQWAKSNPLSNGQPAPASFKGFADSTSTTPPQCGGTWTAKTGSSSKVPDTIPGLMAVLVTSSVSQQGSNASGNITQIVIVKTDPGYQSNGGHAGTGTIVGTICKQ
jgi:YVTN family beta-propeller protein